MLRLNADIDVVARTIYGEARSRPLLDRLAVGLVIRERYLRPGWWTRRAGDGIPDDTWEATCRSPWQFTCWQAHNEAHRRNRDAVMSAEQNDPQTFASCLAVALYVVKYATDADVRQLFHVESVDDFPTHYHHREIPKPKTWGECKVVPTLFDSAHIFYAGVDGTPKRRKQG